MNAWSVAIAILHDLEGVHGEPGPPDRMISRERVDEYVAASEFPADLALGWLVHVMASYTLATLHTLAECTEMTPLQALGVLEHGTVSLREGGPD